mgnify:CR=1 FL=1
MAPEKLFELLSWLKQSQGFDLLVDITAIETDAAPGFDGNKTAGREALAAGTSAHLTGRRP